MYSPDGIIQCACDSNEIFSFVNVSGRNFSPILIKFGKRTAEVIFKADIVCGKKRKYIARMLSNRISLFFSLVIFKQNFSPNLHKFRGQLNSLTPCLCVAQYVLR